METLLVITRPATQEELLTATQEELLNIRNFYPEGCFFHWDSSTEKLSEPALILFRRFNSLEKVCSGCNVRDCKVRCAPNPKF